ncbi:MAG TPA: peroxide stress protein YaaA [Gammaproteobacteria bacterium]
MLTLVSPSKTFDFDTPSPTRKSTQPIFLEDSKSLIDEFGKLSTSNICELMNVSTRLGEQTCERFQNWRLPFTTDNARQAVLAFKGDLYNGLEAESFSASEHAYAQKHLRILSGLHGVLRPLDLIQPYRLEIGTDFVNSRGKNLYEFWGDRITEELNRTLSALKTDVVINLASNEYFRAVHRKKLEATVISPAFKDLRNGNYKIISFYAKKARGQMAGWIIRNRISEPKQLRKFRLAGYRYNADLSAPDAPVFTRDTPPAG